MRSQLPAALLAAFLVFAAVMGLRAAGLLQGFELGLYDHYVRSSAAPTETDSRVVTLEVTEADIRELGHWPISDRVMAETLEAVLDAGARVVGLDIYRDLPVPPGEQRLASLLASEPRIIAVQKFGDVNEGIPGPPALEGTDRVGFNDVAVDPDAMVRRGLLFLDDGSGDPQYSFALRVALQALAAEGIGPQPDPEHPEWLRLGPTTIRPWEASDGGYVGIDDGGYQYLLDFSATGFPRLTVGELLRGEFEPAALRDKMVLIGVNARSLPDFHRVPVETESGIPGIQTHAYMVRQLMRAGLGEASPIRVLADWQESVLIALLALAGCAVALGLRRGSAVQGVSAEVLAILLGLGALWLGGGLAYLAGWWVPMAAPALAWLASTGVLTAWSSSRERAERAQVMMIFSRHVSKRLAEELWRRRDEFFDGGRLRPGRVTATLLFLDMKGYASRAEKMDPQSLMEWINDFMGAMAERVDEFDGYVDDYFGDGIKAAFGVPIPRTTEAEISRDASNAVDCALAMASSLELLNAKYREHDMPTVAMRIGIHTGPVVVGNLGSSERLKYTSVGDVVITAQRLEAIDRVEHDFDRHPCRILISDATRARLGDRHECESLGSFAMKGMEEEVAVNRVVAVKP